jgi:hypothetical protein
MRCCLSSTPRKWAGQFALALLLGVAGCGGNPTGTVTGKVTYQNGPVKGGNVIFASASGKSVIVPIAEDGSYTVADFPLGDAKIAVQTRSLGVLAKMGKGRPANAPSMGGSMSAEDAARRFVAIPPHYEDASTSELTYTVQAGSQQHDLPLKGAAPPKGGPIVPSK